MLYLVPHHVSPRFLVNGYKHQIEFKRITEYSLLRNNFDANEIRTWITSMSRRMRSDYAKPSPKATFAKASGIFLFPFLNVYSFGWRISFISYFSIASTWTLRSIV